MLINKNINPQLFLLTYEGYLKDILDKLIGKENKTIFFMYVANMVRNHLTFILGAQVFYEPIFP